MTSLNVVAFTVLACVGEMLVCLLSIRDASIPSEKLVPAILGVVFAWLVVGWLLNRTYDTDRASAARILKWPSTAFAVVWAVAAGIALVQASQVQLAWLWGGHGLLAVCFGLTNVLFSASSTHVESVEANIAATNDVHANLITSVTQTRLRLGRAGLDTALAQRARIALERAQTVPRMALAGASSEGLVMAVRELGLALESAGDVAAAVGGVEDAVLVVKN